MDRVSSRSARDVALLLALALAAAGSLVLASASLSGSAPPRGPWVGCGLTVTSRVYRVAGMPLWVVPLVAAPLAALAAVALDRRAATVILALAFARC